VSVAPTINQPAQPPSTVSTPPPNRQDSAQSFALQSFCDRARTYSGLDVLTPGALSLAPEARG